MDSYFSLLNLSFVENCHIIIFTTFAKQSMINRLSNAINRNRSAAKISKVMSSSKYPRGKSKLKNHFTSNEYMWRRNKFASVYETLNRNQHIVDTRNASASEKEPFNAFFNLMFQMVEELQGILLEAADDMKPSFHPNRWDIHVAFLLNLEAKQFMQLVWWPLH